MAALRNVPISTGDPSLSSLSGCTLKPPVQSLVMNWSPSLIRMRIPKKQTYRGQVCIRAGLRDGGQPSSASIFVGGFVLGGLVMGTLGCVYAPQISKALVGADGKDLMKKLPKFIYDEERALEKTRQVLSEKIAQLNSAIDSVSSQLRPDDGPNEVSVPFDEIETAM